MSFPAQASPCPIRPSSVLNVFRRSSIVVAVVAVVDDSSGKVGEEGRMLARVEMEVLRVCEWRFFRVGLTGISVDGGSAADGRPNVNPRSRPSSSSAGSGGNVNALLGDVEDGVEGTMATLGMETFVCEGISSVNSVFRRCCSIPHVGISTVNSASPPTTGKSGNAIPCASSMT